MKNARLVLPPIGIILGLLAIEILLRSYSVNGNKTPLTSTYQFNCYERGTFYWYKFKANQSCVLKSNYQAFPDSIIKTNSLGLRNQEIADPKPEGTKRILYLGDSFTVGIGVRDEQSYPRQTETMLNQIIMGQKIETINAGLNGAETSYYYLFLKNSAELIKPDIVVIGFMPSNDVYDDQFKPYWSRLDSQGLPEETDSETIEVNREGNLVAKHLPLLYKFPLLKSSYVFNFLYKNLSENTPNKVPLVSYQVCLHRSNCHDYDEYFDRAKRLFLAMKEISRKNNFQLFVTLIPAEFETNEEARFKYEILLPLSPPERAYLHVYFKQFFDISGIEYLDLLPVLTSESQRGIYFTEDDHWTDAGHRLAALAISQKLGEMVNR